jgi:uncharacterized membrane protein YdjX (TVP38/TMEM64 family)
MSIHSQQLSSRLAQSAVMLPLVNDASSESERPRGRIRRFFHQLGPAGPMALIATVLPALGAVVLIAVAHDLAPWLKSHQPWSLILFVIGFAVLGGFALVPTYANSLLAGWTFGFPIGFPAVMIGLIGAAIISYTFARRVSGHRVEDLIHQHPRWEVVKDALIGQGTWRTIWIVMLLRLSPLLPFETTSVLLAATGVPPLPFIVGTAIGVIPRTAVIVFAASRAHKLDFHQANSRWLLVGGILASALGAVIIALISKHALDRATLPAAPGT